MEVKITFARRLPTCPGRRHMPGESADFFKNLQRIRETCDSPIVVFSLGMGITKPTVSRQFAEWLHANPVPDVHVFPAARHLSESDYLPLDKHLTAEGNRKLAKGLAEFIREQGWEGWQK